VFSARAVHKPKSKKSSRKRINTSSDSSSKNTTMVRHIENMKEFNELMELSKTKLVVIDFTATW
jgi:thiol:disulfide interchange protein